ncbi:MAG: hypothetical protein D6732_23945 [Methanobacteriota archaeon]|nr:MAG: hypothetical protein D6732_23945 [Euryarchaeota archaeon]
MVTSKEAEEKAIRNQMLLDIVRKIPESEIKIFTENLKGLSSCDVERGTEQYWLSSGKERFERLWRIYSIILDLVDKLKTDQQEAIGAFRIRQKECMGTANLSIGRFKDINRLVTRLKPMMNDKEDQNH